MADRMVKIKQCRNLAAAMWNEKGICSLESASDLTESMGIAVLLLLFPVVFVSSGGAAILGGGDPAELDHIHGA